MDKKLKIAVGIPTINRADLLKECLADLAINMSPIEKLYIVDNGAQKFVIPKSFTSTHRLHRPSKNLGVAGSWNYMMQKAFVEDNIDYLLMLNDDIVLGKTLQQILNIIKSNPAVDLFVCSRQWSVFLLSKKIIDKVGYFDEKFFPAYYEDNDYYYRGKLIGAEIITRVTQLNPKIYRASQTIKKDPELEKGSPKNHEYYKKKWGGSPREEKFKTPFNK